jgi:hypothetical protein
MTLDEILEKINKQFEDIFNSINQINSSLREQKNELVQETRQ